MKKLLIRMSTATVHRIELTMLALLVLVATARPAHAYVDPGSGALIWQAVLAAAFGFMFYARRVIKYVRNRLVARRAEKDALTR